MTVNESKNRTSPAELSTVPKKPGVYTFKGPKEKILYVGKAKNLRNRLRSYFQPGAALDARKRSMMKRVRDFSFIVTANEHEALALEANLIKQYRPRFNVILRDDKNYPYIRVSINDEWPTLEVVRRIKKDGSLYFGPYVPTGGMWEALAFIRRHFNIRPCKYRLDKPMRPCIQYEMGKCPAPCAGYITRQEYMKAVEEVLLFLRGRKQNLIEELERRMQRLSEELRFEEAAKLRDRLDALRRAWEPQKVVAPELPDTDVIGLYRDESGDSFQVFFVRNGMMIGAKDFHIEDMAGAPTGELLRGFLEFFYAKEIIPPAEILLSGRPGRPEGVSGLEAWLSGRRGGRVKIKIPGRGKRLDLLRMAEENAKIISRGRRKDARAALGELAGRLSLPSVPRSIGAFDVSSIAGSAPVGAFVFWAGGAFRKDLYRHVRIKTVAGIDDYSMMGETVKRILDGLEEEERPELIVIDGGRGHLEAARKAAGEGGERALMIAVAKDPDRALTEKAEISLTDKSPSSLLLRRIRDEAHRFAISLHKRLRGKVLLKSPLDEIPGVGKKRRLALLRHFGSLDALRRADVEEMAKVSGMNRSVAEAIKEALGKT